jgi:hypothetical protein
MGRGSRLGEPQFAEREVPWESNPRPTHYEEDLTYPEPYTRRYPPSSPAYGSCTVHCNSAPLLANLLAGLDGLVRRRLFGL